MAAQPWARHRYAGVLALGWLVAGCAEGDAQSVPPAPGEGKEAGIDVVSEPSTSDAHDVRETLANVAPTAAFEATPSAGSVNTEVVFDGSSSTDVDGTIVSWEWDFGDGAKATGKTAKHSYAHVGCFGVKLTVIDNDAATDLAHKVVVATAGEPSGTPKVTFQEMPKKGALLPRNQKTNKGLARVRGQVWSAGYHSVVVELLDQGQKVVESQVVPLCTSAQPDPFEAVVGVPAELATYQLRVGLAAGPQTTQVAILEDLVAGDVLLIQGQSNAVASQRDGDANVNQGPFVRSYGTHAEDLTESLSDEDWHRAEGNAAEGKGAIGQWGLRLGRRLVEQHKIPLALLNGGQGGKPITYFLRNNANASDPVTNYGRLLSRARNAEVDKAVRAILYYQGESDGDNAQGHHDGFLALRKGWLQDYPALERIYVTQVRPGCGSPTPALFEVQRRFGELPNVTVMSTNGLDGHDGCHYSYAKGYEVIGDRYAALLSRDLYGESGKASVEAPNLKRVFFSNQEGSQLTIELTEASETLTWQEGTEAFFEVSGSSAKVQSAKSQAGALLLTLSPAAPSATHLTYKSHTGAGPWVANSAGIGLLSFAAIQIEAK